MPCYQRAITADARLPIFAVALVTLFAGLFFISAKLLKGVELPDYLLPVGLVIMTADLGWRFVKWLRARPPRSVGEMKSDGS